MTVSAVVLLALVLLTLVLLQDLAVAPLFPVAHSIEQKPSRSRANPIQSLNCLKSQLIPVDESKSRAARRFSITTSWPYSPPAIVGLLWRERDISPDVAVELFIPRPVCSCASGGGHCHAKDGS